MSAVKCTRFVLGVVARMAEDGTEPEFLVVKSVSTDPTTGLPGKEKIKFPGGMERVMDEPISIMLPREILEETYLTMVDPDKAVKIWEMPIGSGHIKLGFLIDFADCVGTLRTEVLEDDDDDDESCDSLSPPFWAKASVLKYDLFPGHQPALTEALRYIESHPLRSVAS
jgi:hypothetical protein